MSDRKLDQLVKGAPAPFAETSSMPTSGVFGSSAPGDPLASLPSSPPQIYLNLLILEASLRAQYLELLARRRQHTFFLTLLFLWTVSFGYALFFAPREDGSGVGGSIYWAVEVTEKVAFMGGIVTAILIWGTGQWERGVRWPRRWVGITNRGLRGFNCKIVVVRKTWWREWLDLISFFLNGGLFSVVGGGLYRFVDASLLSGIEKEPKSQLARIQEEDGIGHFARRGREEDLAAGGDTISLLLLPKPFSPTFRENWDLYRSEYWERENARRAQILQRIRAHDKAILKKQRAQEGWLSWLIFWRRSKTKVDIEKVHHGHVTHNKHSGHAGAEKRFRSGSTAGRSGSQSRNSSRTSTPIFEAEDSNSLRSQQRTRRSSNASNASTDTSRKRRSNTGTSTSNMRRSGSPSSTSRMQRLSAPKASSGSGSGSPASSPGSEAERDENGTPPSPSPPPDKSDGSRGTKNRTSDPLLRRDNSFNSMSSLDISPEESVGPDGEDLHRRSSSISSAG